MLQNAYLVAKIGADTAENEQQFAEILPIGRIGRSCFWAVLTTGELGEDDMFRRIVSSFGAIFRTPTNLESGFECECVFLVITKVLIFRALLSSVRLHLLPHQVSAAAHVPPEPPGGAGDRDRARGVLRPQRPAGESLPPSRLLCSGYPQTDR